MASKNIPKIPPAQLGSRLVKFGVTAGVVVYAAENSLYNVEGGHRAIVFNRITGIKNKVVIKARPHLVESTSGSRDLQMVNSVWPGMAAYMYSQRNALVKIGLRVLTRPYADELPTIFRSVGTNYNERVLPDIIHETLKAVVARYNASQLITQREAVSREIRSIMTEKAKYFNIALDDVSITSLTFGKEFTAAIEAKQVAAQEVERAKFIVKKAEQDRKSAVIRAEGEAKSAQLIGQAIANNPAFITLRKIEAAREIAQTMSHSSNKVFLDSSDLLLNLHDLEMKAIRRID